MTSLTLTQTGNATPFSIFLLAPTLPEAAAAAPPAEEEPLYSLAHAASMTSCPNLHSSNTVVPGRHLDTSPLSARFTTRDASWYLVHTSLSLRSVTSASSSSSAFFSSSPSSSEEATLTSSSSSADIFCRWCSISLSLCFSPSLLSSLVL